ncbi:MAG: hypothetical protein Kow00127_01640 [Bacteroidales bacterium]
MVRNLIIIYIFLASATFFRLTYLPKNLMLLGSFATIILMALGILMDVVYFRGKKFPMKFSTEVGLLFLAVLFGIFGAKWGHDQSFGLSIWVLTPLYYYLFYFFLHSIRVNPKDLERMIVLMGWTFLGLFFLQYMMYPTMIFGARAQEARGTIRIFIPGGAFAGYTYFLFLQKSFTSNNRILLVFCLLYLVVPVLQGTRSSIVTILLTTVIFILFSRKVKSKPLVFLLMASAAVLIFFLFKDIFMNLIEVSNEQASQDEDDVRIRAARFFLTDFVPTPLNYIIGNGESHMMSAYGMRIWYYKITYGFYQNDLGLIGEYVKFGVVWVIGVFLIFRKLFALRVHFRYGFLKFWGLLLIFSELTGGVFSRPTVIVVITSVMYMYDVSYFELAHLRKEYLNKEEETNNEEINLVAS